MPTPEAAEASSGSSPVVVSPNKKFILCFQYQTANITALLGGKHFSRDLRPLDADGNEISMWNANAEKKSDDDDEEDSSEESSEEDSDAGPSQQTGELTRDERKQAKKAQKEAAIAKKNKTVQVGDMPSDSESEEDEDMPVNPNHSKAARNMTKAQPDPVEEVTEGVKNVAMSRKERESMEALQAKERYRKLHEAGKTDEAKADLARLKLIREKREAETARKQVCYCLSRLMRRHRYANILI